jgi:hypothetical protein
MPGFAILRLRIAIPVVSGGYQFSQLTNDEIQRPPYLAALSKLCASMADCVAKVGGTWSDRPKRAILESGGVNF